VPGKSFLLEKRKRGKIGPGRGEEKGEKKKKEKGKNPHCPFFSLLKLLEKKKEKGKRGKKKKRGTSAPHSSFLCTAGRGERTRITTHLFSRKEGKKGKGG